MFKNKTALSYGVIGLGRFGSALARTLAESGSDVLVIDSSPLKVKELRDYTEHAFVAQELTREVLEDAGVQNCDVVIVCIGEKIDTSILTTLNVVSLGVPRVIAKAISPDQGLVLEKIGAEVVYPEHDMAVRLAKKLLSGVPDYISLTHGVDIAAIHIRGRLIGQSIVKLDFRRKFGLNIVAIEHGGETMTEVDPSYVFREGDVAVVIGRQEKIERLDAYVHE